MKFRNLIATSTLVLATAFAGIASANLSTGNLGNDVQSAVGSGSVTAILSNGVVKLFGDVETRVDANAAEQAAASFKGVDEVISYINVDS